MADENLRGESPLDQCMYGVDPYEPDIVAADAPAEKD